MYGVGAGATLLGRPRIKQRPYPYRALLKLKSCLRNSGSFTWSFYEASSLYENYETWSDLWTRFSLKILVFLKFSFFLERLQFSLSTVLSKVIFYWDKPYSFLNTVGYFSVNFCIRINTAHGNNYDSLFSPIIWLTSLAYRFSQIVHLTISEYFLICSSWWPGVVAATFLPSQGVSLCACLARPRRPSSIPSKGSASAPA